MHEPIYIFLGSGGMALAIWTINLLIRINSKLAIFETEIKNIKERLEK